MKKRLPILILVILFASCKKEKFDIQNLNGNKISKLGHAGMGTGNTYPMNTAESILKCLNYNMSGTEMDIQLTKDSVLVAFHDEDLKFKTNFFGKINDYTWKELQEARYIVTPHIQYKIISIDSLFKYIEPTQYTFAFDIKLYSTESELPFLKKFKNAIVNLLEKYNMTDNVFIESQNTTFLNLIDAEKPSCRLFYYPESFEEGLTRAESNHYDGITISTRSVTKTQIEQAHQNGLQVAIWNTHTKKDNKEGILKNPDIIETDQVPYLSRTLN